MTVTIHELRLELSGRKLPGGRLVIEPHEAQIGDAALRATPGLGEDVHPAWFVIASLRCMGISVQDLCDLARQEDGDTLLFGRCRVDQLRPLRAGAAYRAAAEVGEVATRHTRDGSRLDSIEVAVRLQDEEGGSDFGRIISTYLFKRRIGS